MFTTNRLYLTVHGRHVMILIISYLMFDHLVSNKTLTLSLLLVCDMETEKN